MRVLIVALLLVAGSFAEAGGQELRTGTRIRVANPTLVDGVPVGSLVGGTFEGSATGWYVGQLIEMDARSITLETASGEILTLPRSNLTRLEVSAATMEPREASFRGARRGTGVGFFIGVGLAGFYRAIAEGDEELPRSTEVKVVGVSTLVGLGLGYLYGSNVTERWEAVDAPRVSATADPSGGVRLGVSLRF